MSLLGRFIDGGVICGMLRRDLPRWWSRRSRAEGNADGVAAVEIEFGRDIRVRIAATAPAELAPRGHQGAGGAMIALPTGVRVWIAAGHTDMRRGMQSLALQVQEGLKRDPHAGDLYVFRGRSGSLIKILWHDGIGMSLYAKRLERGRFIWPSADVRRCFDLDIATRLHAGRYRLAQSPAHLASARRPAELVEPELIEA